MRCSYCDSDNVPGQRYCGSCGKQLSNGGLEANVLETIDQRVAAALDARLRDQKVVEIEVSQAIATRILEWSKLFGYAAALPLAILLGTLAIWGIGSFLDFQKKVETASSKITAGIDAANNKVHETNQQADQLRLSAASLQKELDATRVQLGALPTDVKGLQVKVQQLEEKVNFAATPDLTPQLYKQLNATLDQYRAFAARLGFHAKPGDVNVVIEPGLKEKTGDWAYYEIPNSEILVDSSKASDTTYLLRQYSNRMLDDVPSRPTATKEWLSIESALASYLPASFLKNSRAQEWDLATFTKIPDDHCATKSYVACGVEVWGSAFWELRSLIGAPQCDKLLVVFWKKLDPYKPDAYTSYALATLLEAYRDSGGNKESAVQAIFLHRSIS
jgi:hypothetical protein